MNERTEAVLNPISLVEQHASSHAAMAAVIADQRLEIERLETDVADLTTALVEAERERDRLRGLIAEHVETCRKLLG